jgi:hypothetical protein
MKQAATNRFIDEQIPMLTARNNSQHWNGKLATTIMIILLENGKIKEYNDCIVILLLFGKRGLNDY